MMILFLIALASVYQYFYGGKYSRIYISELESKCHSDEASCKILQAIYKEKCDKGDRKACINAYIHKHKDLRAIKDNNQWNLVNENNKILVENVFDYTRNFSEGLAAVKLNGKWGFIDTSGKIAIEPKFDDVKLGFIEGLAEVLLNGKWVYIDKKGNIISKD
ncbi:WG repeat-containing protein [Campylobacter lari]